MHQNSAIHHERAPTKIRAKPDTIMTLTQQIADFEKEKQRTHERDVLDMIDVTTADLVNTGIAAQSLSVGDTAPAFTLPDHLGNTVALSDLLQSGPVLINFYRGEWCPYCNLELRAYQKHLDRIKAAGTTLIAISPMLPDSSLDLAEKHELAFPVLSDVGNKVADQFGLMFTVDDRIQAMYLERLGNDLPKLNGDNSFTLPLPATYVIGGDGVITYAYVNADYRLRADPEDVLTTL
jgi:peroxiredoxin